MNKIVLVGMPGSGKSKIISELKNEFKTLIVDDFVDEIYKKNGKAYKKIIKEFGKKVSSDDGIDKKKLSKLVLDNRDNLEILNSIVHPLIQDEISKDYQIVEMPIINSKHINYKFDKYIKLTDNREICKLRLINKRNVNPLKADLILDLFTEPLGFVYDLEIESNKLLKDINLIKKLTK